MAEGLNRLPARPFPSEISHFISSLSVGMGSRWLTPFLPPSASQSVLRLFFWVGKLYELLLVVWCFWWEVRAFFSLADLRSAVIRSRLFLWLYFSPGCWAMMSGEEERWCVVTGGRGFVARHLVEMLIKDGTYLVIVADLGSEMELERYEENGVLGEALRSGRARYVSGDLRDKARVLEACRGAEVIFHMAAPDSSINNYHLHYSVNVLGTRNVIDACIKLNVKRLIYTSSLVVVFDGVHGIFNGDESLPYPTKHNDSYSATKAEGEALVIESNGINGLLTCCIRPSSIFGPGDKLLVPTLVSAGKAGQSKFIIGDGSNMYDFTYVENIAHAHICADRALASAGEKAKRASGQAYFITNMEPIKFWEFASLILEGLGYERPRIKIPIIVVMPVAHFMELTYRLLGHAGMKFRQLIPSHVRLLSSNATFDCSKARDLLGYTPVVSFQEGIKRTLESFADSRAENLRPKREGPSRAPRYLGNGRVAEMLLWKDKRMVIGAVLALAAIYYTFIASTLSASAGR